MVSWWDKKYGKNKICAITYTRIRPGKNKDNLSYALTLPCKHVFCRSAIQNAICVSKTVCPLCRKEFDPIIAFM